MKGRLSLAAALLLAALALAGCATLRGDSGWHTLIDGAKGLDNWTSVGGANWRAEDAAIVVDRRPGTDGTFLVSEDGKLPSGPIALQYAGGVVKFRKVQVRPL